MRRILRMLERPPDLSPMLFDPVASLNVWSLPNRSGERTFSPPSLSLLPHSAKRTQVRSKSLLKRVWFRQISLEPTDGFGRKSAVYGLNGQDAHSEEATLSTSDHRVAGSSPAGCKLHTIRNLYGAMRRKNRFERSITCQSFATFKANPLPSARQSAAGQAPGRADRLASNWLRTRGCR
jgi:hypothetical protein